MGEKPSLDVEERRIEELLTAQSLGTATEAETEELALYVEAHPNQLRARVEQAVQHGRLGRGWLERVERDRQVDQIAQSGRAQTERNVGLILMGGGLGLQWVLPMVGTWIVVIGVLLMLYSVIRVRLKTHRVDPYKDIVR